MQRQTVRRAVYFFLSTLFMGATLFGHVPIAKAADTDTYPWSNAPCEWVGTGNCTNYDWYMDENGDGHFTGNSCDSGSPSGECYDTFGYQYRNCTSYVAQKIDQIFGISIAGWGHAEHWETAAQAHYTLDPTNAPRIGDIAQWDDERGHGYGHVAYVYAVNGSIASFDEYNYAGTGIFSSTNTSSNEMPDHYIHIGTLPEPGGDSSNAPETQLPAAVSSTGGLTVFAKGLNGQLYNTWQTSPGSGWVPWMAVSNGGSLSASPIVYKGTDGTLAAFAINSDGHMETSWQTTPGSGWQQWAIIGGNSATLQGTPAVSTAATGGLILFARGVDNQLYDTWQTAPGGDWVPWTVVVGGAYDGSQPAIYESPSGALSAYVISPAGYLMTSWQASAGSGWQPWVRIGGSTTITGVPTVELASTGGLTVFAKGRDGQLYNTWQTAPGGSWVTLQPVIPGNGVSSSPAIYRDSNGVFAAFVINTAGDLVTTWQTSPGSGWQPWARIGGTGITITGIPSIQTAATGGLIIFARGSDGQLYNTWQTSPGGSWVPWQLALPGAIIS